MRRTILLVAGVLLSVVALGSDSPKEYDDRTEVAGIEGTWQLTNVKCGNNIPKIGQNITTFRGGICTTIDSDGESRCSYRIDTTHKPFQLDWILPSRAVKCIYLIEGDTLWIAEVLYSDQPRPRDFKGIDVIICTYKRVR